MKANMKLVVRALIVAALFGTVSAQAAGEFDLSASTLILTGIAATAATLVGSVIALSAGMDAWKKIRGFFNRAR